VNTQKHSVDPSGIEYVRLGNQSLPISASQDRNAIVVFRRTMGGLRQLPHYIRPMTHPDNNFTTLSFHLLLVALLFSRSSHFCHYPYVRPVLEPRKGHVSLLECRSRPSLHGHQVRNRNTRHIRTAITRWQENRTPAPILWCSLLTLALSWILCVHSLHNCVPTYQFFF